MKVKLSKSQIQRIVDDPQAAEEAKIKVGDPWWLIVIKVIGYICGLIAGGVITVSCSHAVGLL